MKKQVSVLLSVLLFVLVIAGCAVESVSDSTKPTTVKYYIYYMNENYDQLVSEVYKPESADSKELLREFREELESTEDAPSDAHPLLSDGVSIKSSTLRDGVLYLNMSEDYNRLDGAKELLVRAGLVKTFTQCEGVSYVRISVAGKSLIDSYGNEIGKLSPDNFLENAGRSIHSYQSADMVLYYTNEAGDQLVKENRSVYYSSNEPLERAVVEELVRGTSLSGHYAAISPDTKVLSVAIQDGVCYVNFDEKFKSGLTSASEEVQIYSVVNSLIDTCRVTKVQFSINGKSDITFRKDMRLDTQYQKNEDLISS